MEEWKAIEGTNGKYEVSNTGKVRSMNYGGHGNVQEMKPVKDQKGYMRIKITKNGKPVTSKVHRLVAEAFVDNPTHKPEVNHKNGNKTDNRADNLEWSTAHENTLHAYKTGLKEKNRERCREMGRTVGKEALAKAIEKQKTPVIAVRIIDGAVLEFPSQADASIATGAPQGNINKVLNGKRKSARGYVFRYKEVVKK